MSDYASPAECLTHYRQLLEWEHQAEIEYFEEKILRTPLEKRVEQGTCWFPLWVARSGYTTGEHIFLELEKQTTEKRRHVFQAGQVVALFRLDDQGNDQGQRLNGVIAKVSRDTMKVVFSRTELPQWVFSRKDQLGIDLYFDETTYKEMAAVLHRLANERNNHLAELRDTLLGFARAGFRETVERQVYPKLNPAQETAAHLVERTELAGIVHGPPGTGKTTTLVAAIAQTLKSEPQVLVCAPSNTAVDVLTERLAAEGVRVLRLGHPVRVSDDLQEHTLDAQLARHPDYKTYKQLRQEAFQLKSKAAKFQRKYRKGQRRDQFREANQMLSDARQLEDFMLFDLLNTAQAITCTLVGSTGKVLGKRKFQTVFIDEAAQALLPASFLPITRARRVIFAGDHQQLPPTVKSRKAGRRGLELSLMEFFRNQQSKRWGNRVDAMLVTQYRMHRQIMAFPNRWFYNGELLADESVAEATLLPENLPEHPPLNRPLEFIDTAGCGYLEEQNPETLSRFNVEEAELLLAHLFKTCETLETHLPADAALNIGLITPYKAQVYQLLERFREHDFRSRFPHHFQIDTVDGFQGQERDVIYISLVRANDKGEIGFLGDLRRMNVAMTRARQKLVIIGDSATVGQHSFFAQLVAEAEEQNAYRSAFEFMY